MSPSVSMSRPGLAFTFSKEVLFFINCSKARKRSLLIFEIQFPVLLFLRLFKTTKIWKVVTKNKMNNPRFTDEEDISLIHQDDDDYNTQDSSRVEKTSFIEPDTTEATLTLQLRQKLKRDKITSLYRYLNVTGDPGLADKDRLMIKKKKKNQNQNQSTLNYFFSMVITIGNPSLINVPVRF